MKRVLCLVGPTASGKTEVALELSKIVPTEIISCDSMQVYRDMPILTQAPPRSSPRRRGSDSRLRGNDEIKTHLVSFVKPSHEYDAAKFRKDAGALILKILKKKKTPLIVGGTGLYLRSLLDGLFETPEGQLSRDESYRKKLIEEQERQGEDYLHRKLAKVDALSAKKIHANDTRRLVRALEVFHLSGKPISEQKSKRSGIRGQYDVRIFLLERDRQELYARVNRCVEIMLEEGLLEEVKHLQEKKLSQTAEMALGFREMSAYLKGSMKKEEAVELLKKNTRHYAKRQLSWFRHELGVEKVEVSSGDTAKEIAGRILKALSS